MTNITNWSNGAKKTKPILASVREVATGELSRKSYFTASLRPTRHTSRVRHDSLPCELFRFTSFTPVEEQLAIIRRDVEKIVSESLLAVVLPWVLREVTQSLAPADRAVPPSRRERVKHFIEKVIGLNRNPFGFRQFPMFLWSQFPHEACRWPIRIFLGGHWRRCLGPGRW